MEGFEYIAELKDGMGGPAKEARAALGGLGQELKRLGAQTDAVGSHMRGVASAHRGLIDVERGFFRELGGSFVPQIALGELAGEAIKELGRKVYETGKEILEFAIDAAEAKENAISAFNAMGQSGEEMFGDLTRLARNIHAPVERAVGLAQELMAMGMERTDHIQATIA